MSSTPRCAIKGELPTKLPDQEERTRMPQHCGTFSVETFLEQVGAAEVQVVNDVLAEEGLAIKWEWGGPPAGSRPNTPPISRKAP
jgi:hypothetical protein